MEKYIFILGKNYLLALAELDAYLQTSQYQGKIVDYSTICAIVEFDDQSIELEDIGNLMIRLGGVQKIGRMYDFVELETVNKAFPVDIETNRALIYGGRRYIDNTLKDLVFELFPEIQDKSFFIATSIYPESFDDPYYASVLVKFGLHYFNKFFNTYLKEKGAKKAIYYKYPQENIEKGNLNPIFPHHYFAYKLYEPERAEILYCMTDLGMYIGRTITVVDSNLQKALDADRPYKKFKQTIPPKFGKTLLSLLQLDEPLTDKRILDPFCGSGTILQFAYLMGMQIYGADQVEEQVVGSRKNLLYTADLLGRNIPKEEIQKRILTTDINTIDTHFNKHYFDGLATEPVLLPYFEKFPGYTEMVKIIDEEVIPPYEQLFLQSYNLLKPNSRLALVAPVVFTQDHKQIGLPIHEMATGAGFKAVQILRTDRFDAKENPRYNFDRGYSKNLFDKGTKHLMREFYVFARPEE
ncbi:MAG: hypothetical protein E4G98_06215 [Promethearchaeota archaeon]|nr:MAG: hypothetical protein E4G98_06215 [Candidatus Lokiarchaeota archaeon]